MSNLAGGPVRRKATLDVLIRSCKNCGPDMNVPGHTKAAPGFGSLRSPVMIVGQSLCGGPCMDREEPFVGGCGKLLDDSFELAGIAKRNLFITNVVHCHPPNNRRSTAAWKLACRPYLYEELDIVKPKLIIGLGNDAKAALRLYYSNAAQELAWPFRTPRSGPTSSSPRLHFARHPSSILRDHDKQLERRYVASLARAFRWAFER